VKSALSKLRKTRTVTTSGGYFLLSLLSLFCIVAVSGSAAAQQSSRSIAQGFEIDSGSEQIVAGALVSITKDNAERVEPATNRSVERLIGIVDKNPLLVISGNTKEVQVVLSGTTSALVSDINGPIEATDKITASPIAGVGMLATSDSQVVGTAQAKLDAATTHTRSVTDTGGNPHDVRIGYIPVQVGIAYYQAPGSNFLPPFIQSLADSVAGRPVSLLRILLCTILLLIGFIGITTLIYSSVRSAMTSLGRNPLAASAIRKGLYQVIVVAVVALGATILACYLVLAV
jgi:hypothetical protein